MILKSKIQPVSTAAVISQHSSWWKDSLYSLLCILAALLKRMGHHCSILQRVSHMDSRLIICHMTSHFINEGFVMRVFEYGAESDRTERSVSMDTGLCLVS